MTAAADRNLEQRLARDIKQAAEAELILNFQAAEPMEWVEAIDFLVATSEFEAARFAIRQILAVRHDLAYAHNVIDVLDRIPEADAETLSFRDDLASEVQIVRRDGADAVILVFGDYSHHAGIALSIAHRWFRRLPASLVYLRDFRRLFFREGVPTLGAGREATVAKLREIIRSLGASRVLCFGNSSGAFAALHYGLDLSARTVLSLSGFSRLVFEALPRDLRSNNYRNHPISKQPIDLRELYSRVANPPTALLFYGDGHPHDRAQAEHMAGIKNAKLVPVENCATHMVQIELIRRGAFERTLRWLCEE
jgi:hypothetical protein